MFALRLYRTAQAEREGNNSPKLSEVEGWIGPRPMSDQEDVIWLAGDRLGLADLLRCEFIHGKKRENAPVCGNLPCILTEMPQTCVMLEKEVDCELHMFEQGFSCKVHLSFTETGFYTLIDEAYTMISEGKDDQYVRTVFYEANEPNAARILENFTRVMVVFALAVKEFSPDLYEMAVFQDWIDEYKPVGERIKKSPQLSTSLEKDEWAELAKSDRRTREALNDAKISGGGGEDDVWQ